MLGEAIGLTDFLADDGLTDRLAIGLTDRLADGLTDFLGLPSNHSSDSGDALDTVSEVFIAARRP